MYTFDRINPDRRQWSVIENCYDGTVDKTEAMMVYVARQGAVPFVAEVRRRNCLVGFFVGEIVRRGVRILASPTLGLGIAHQGLSMLEVITAEERLQIYKDLAEWVFNSHFASFIEIGDFQLEMEDLRRDGTIRFEGHDTSWIDLTRSEEEIWHGMDYKSCRYMINKAVKAGIVVRETENPEQFLDLHFKQHLAVMSRHGEFAAKSRKNLGFLAEAAYGKSLVMLEAVNENNIGTGSVNEPLVTAMFLMDRHNCHFFSRACYSSELSSGANELIMWEAIKRSRAMGASFFNNSGVGPFKMKFGAVRAMKPRLYFTRYGVLLDLRRVCFDLYHRHRRFFNFKNNRSR